MIFDMSNDGVERCNMHLTIRLDRSQLEALREMAQASGGTAHSVAESLSLLTIEAECWEHYLKQEAAHDTQ